MSSFHKISRFDLLKKSCYNLIVPEGVLEEFSEEFDLPNQIKPSKLNQNQLETATKLGLGKGESQAI